MPYLDRMMTEYELRQAERIATLELEVKTLKELISNIDGKMDELLSLKQKGMGAIWFATILFGAGSLGLTSFLMSWFKGHY